MVESKLINNQDAIINQLSETEGRWFAVYTKYKCEKYVSEQLQKRKILAYVPVITRTRKYERKIKRYDVPLINCYVFVHIIKSEYLPVLETEYVMKFLKQGKDLLAIPDHEIQILKRVTGDINHVELIENAAFEEGEEVEVIAGHLTGVRGKVISKLGKKSFLVELKTLGFQLMVNVDIKLLRPVKIAELSC
ncbi:MAG TPA: UpxY family transcription antiterminator [Saprospiraceae bacterium]|jgi:transcription antitermination factor NusG|nr:UpxY family transcription antiterminator [Saprospiraceae bacterium]HQV66332.1 UpxY family transcription antiterminator [Saprospiraceae bacterium]HQV97232.1 UpxY family transcription antiterminator [Saprospiraceae bacterium]HRG42136.1 UpxY family transcription antiterminator [Saprospiraceae bacterium]